MQKLDIHSEEVLPSAINLFGTEPTLIGFQQSNNVEYNPITPIGNGPIQFSINSGNSYVDLSSIYLVTRFRLTKKEGDKQVPITNADPVSFIQGFGGTFIKNLRVSFNGRSVYNANDLYAYNAYLRRRLGLGVSRAVEDLEASGYFEDGLDQLSGPGFEARRSLYENGSTFETACTLDVDIFRQKKLLLNQMIVDIEITPHNNFFALLNTSKNEYQYHIVDCKLYTKQQVFLPQLDLDIQEKLNKDVLAKYNYKRNIMKNYFVSPGRYDFAVNLFNDYVPKRIFAALVDAKSFTGHIGMSPFQFGAYNLESIRVATNGILTPAFPYVFDWANKKFGRAYEDLNNAVDTSHGISPQKFFKHSAIYGFDLQALREQNFIEPQTIGATSISLTFKEPVPQNGLQLIIFGEFNSILALDKTRTVTTAMSV